MGKKQDKVYAELMAMIKSMQDPAKNPAQQYLTNEALAGAEFLKKGEYGQLPKGMFFNFQGPAEQIKQYQKFANVGREGTFGLGDGGGMGAAMDTQSKFLGDRFARDAAQNYQNNIAGAAADIRGGLASAAGAKSSNDQAIIGALQGVGNLPFLNKPGMGGALLGLAGSLGGAALGAWKGGI